MNENETKKAIRERYGKIAQASGGFGCGPSCGPATESMCGAGCDPRETQDKSRFAKAIGYTDEELQAIPKEANLGLGCGNPTALAGLKKGETVLDLGAGAGFDVFLAAAKVGPTGKAIGVDMTHEMLEKARENAEKKGIENAEFRLGDIENLPVADSTADVVISNCVINLASDKRRVFQEIYRVLKPGGRVSITDIALQKELPQNIRNDITAYTGCVSGAVLIDEYREIVESSGLSDVKIDIRLGEGNPIGIVSVGVEGYK